MESTSGDAKEFYDDSLSCSFSSGIWIDLTRDFNHELTLSSFSVQYRIGIIQFWCRKLGFSYARTKKIWTLLK